MAEQNIKEQAEKIVEKVKAIVKDGNASRIYLKRKGETLLNLSLNTGIIGAVVGLTAAPFTILTTALVSFGLDCEIEIEKKDGTIINLSETELGSMFENAKDTVFDKAKEIIGKDGKADTQNVVEVDAEAEEKAE